MKAVESVRVVQGEKELRELKSMISGQQQYLRQFISSQKIKHPTEPLKFLANESKSKESSQSKSRKSSVESDNTLLKKTLKKEKTRVKGKISKLYKKLKTSCTADTFNKVSTLEETLKVLNALSKASANKDWSSLFTVYRSPDLSYLSECPALERFLDFINLQCGQSYRAPMTART